MKIPVLRKDFIIDPYQIYESKLYGADIILLIVRILKKEQLDEFIDLAVKLNLDVLIEFAGADEIANFSKNDIPCVSFTNKEIPESEKHLNEEYQNELINLFYEWLNNIDNIKLPLDIDYHYHYINFFPILYVCFFLFI